MDTYTGDFGIVTKIQYMGEIMYRVDYFDGSLQYFEEESDAVAAVTDYSGSYYENES